MKTNYHRGAYKSCLKLKLWGQKAQEGENEEFVCYQIVTIRGQVFIQKISYQFDHAIMAAMCNSRINRELWLFFFSAGLLRAGGVYPSTNTHESQLW